DPLLPGAGLAQVLLDLHAALDGDLVNGRFVLAEVALHQGEFMRGREQGRNRPARPTRGHKKNGAASGAAPPFGSGYRGAISPWRPRPPSADGCTRICASEA